MEKKIVLMTSVLMAVSFLSACKQHTHDWGEVTYTWSEDNKTCVAERVCKGDENHKETETANSTYAVVASAKCETDGTGRYSVSFVNEAFAPQTKDITLEAIDHNWGAATYVWADDNSTCTAKRVCLNDATHVESETKNSVYEAVTPATCETAGVGKYTVTFENEAFETQKKENVTIAALQHDYQFDSFVWSDKWDSAQAKYVCSHDASHVEMHPATVRIEVTTQPGCESKGVRTYTASYDGHVDTKTEEVAANGHSLIAHAAKPATCTETGITAYWSCENCDKYFSDENGEHEIAADSWIVPANGHQMTHHDAVSSPICTTIGNIEYWSCSVCDKYFTDENGNNEVSKDAVKDQYDHVWNAATYEWNEDHTKCTARHVCQIDESHVETEEVDAVLGELASTGCYLYGLVANFKTAGFESQIYDYYRLTLDADGASYTIYQGNHVPSNVVIPKVVNNLPVTKIGYEGFTSENITTMVISNTIIAIERYGIHHAHNLTTITFEEGSALERIEMLGIDANYGLLSIVDVPASLTFIGDYGLSGNYDCASISYLGTTEQWRAIQKGTDWNRDNPACGAIHCTDGDVDDHYVSYDPWDDDDDDDDPDPSDFEDWDD